MSAREVLAFYRRLLTAADNDAQQHVTVPAAWAGWVATDDGDRAGVAEIRDRLLPAVANCAGLTHTQRVVTLVDNGLSRWPDTRRARLSRQVPTQTGRPLTVQRVISYRNSALDVLDSQLVGHPGPRAVSTSLVAEPHLEAGLAGEPNAAQVDGAVRYALGFVAAAGIEDYRASLVTAEIHRWHAAVRGITPRWRASTSRARAAVAIGLRNLLRPVQLAELAQLGVRQVDDGDVDDAGPVGRFLRGHADPDSLRAVLVGVAQGSVPIDVDVLADMLLHVVATDRRYRDATPQPRVVADVLLLAVRQRTVHDDPTAIGLAAMIAPQHRAVAIAARQTAVKVASAHMLWRLADQLVADSSQLAALPGPINAHLDEALDRDEYQLWAAHQRSGTLRRRIEAGAARPDHARLAATLADDVERRLDGCLVRAEHVAGDTRPEWRYYTSVRRAELATMRGAVLSADRALQVARAAGMAGRELVHADKAALELAVRRGDPEAAAELLWTIHAAGWPLERSTAAVVSRLSPQAPADPLTDAAIAVAKAQAADGWVPTVDGRQRRSVLRARSGFNFRAVRRLS